MQCNNQPEIISGFYFINKLVLKINNIIVMKSNQQKLNILTWVFFASKGISDNSDLMRAQMLILECIAENATVESVKNSTGYWTCLNDLPKEMLSDEYLKSIIEFEIK